MILSSETRNSLPAHRICITRSCDWANRQSSAKANVIVNVHVYSPDIPVSSVDCSIDILGIETYYLTVSSPLGRIQHLYTLLQLWPSLKFSILVPPGIVGKSQSHGCLGDKMSETPVLYHNSRPNLSEKKRSEWCNVRVCMESHVLVAYYWMCRTFIVCIPCNILLLISIWIRVFFALVWTSVNKFKPTYLNIVPEHPNHFHGCWHCIQMAKVACSQQPSYHESWETRPWQTKIWLKSAKNRKVLW